MKKHINWQHKKVEMSSGGKQDINKAREEHIDEMAAHIEEFLDDWNGGPIALVQVNGKEVKTAILGAGKIEESLTLVEALREASKDMLIEVLESAREHPGILMAIAAKLLNEDK